MRCATPPPLSSPCTQNRRKVVFSKAFFSNVCAVCGTLGPTPSADGVFFSFLHHASPCSCSCALPHTNRVACRLRCAPLHSQKTRPPISKAALFPWNVSAPCFSSCANCACCRPHDAPSCHRWQRRRHAGGPSCHHHRKWSRDWCCRCFAFRPARCRHHCLRH